MGLEESLGKTYVSNSFFTMNSRYYIVTDTKIRHVGFINMGLLMGVRRSVIKSTKIVDEEFTNLGDIYNEMMDLCPEQWKERAQRVFFYKNMNALRPFKGEWNFPKTHGGLGFNIPLSKNKLRLLSAVLSEDFPSFPMDKDWSTFDDMNNAIREVIPFSHSKLATPQDPVLFSKLFYLIWFERPGELHCELKFRKQRLVTNDKIGKILYEGRKRMKNPMRCYNRQFFDNKSTILISN